MVFWGVEVKPGKPFRQIAESAGELSRLHVSQAVLGLYDKVDKQERTVVKCKVGDAPEIFICSLRPGQQDALGLDLIFDDDVTFSVSGPTSVHLTGYYMGMDEEDDIDDDDLEDMEDGMEEEDLDGLSDEDEDPEDGSDSEDEMEDIEPPKSTVVIEELEEEKANGDHQVAKGKKKGREAKNGGGGDEEEEEDEDGFMKTKKRTAEEMLEDTPEEKLDTPVKSDAGLTPEDKKKKNKKQRKKKKTDKVKDLVEEGKSSEPASPSPASPPVASPVSELQSPAQVETKAASNDAEEKNASKADKKLAKNLKKNLAKKEAGANKKKKIEEPVASEAGASPATKEDKAKESQSVVRKFPNGLEVQQLKMGKPDGKLAKAGKTVTVNYIGKLANGKVFDSSVGKRPFAFRIGTGQVIKGWDIGVNGMRIGDKRRLTVPPSLGYGSQGVRGAIPANATLTFDVELIGVKD